MLGDNLKLIRKQKNITQEELAAKVNVVRQTVSKWEKGLSVPDASTLQKIADVLDVEVSQLLGAEITSEEKTNELAEQLARINEQLVIKNRRAHKVWKAIGMIFVAFVAVNFLLIVLCMVGAGLYSYQPESRVTEVTEQLGEDGLLIEESE